MIWVLLQSESPWQRNDPIMFFIYLRVSLYSEFFFNISLKGVCSCHVALIMAKFEQILREHFENNLKQSLKSHKNSENNSMLTTQFADKLRK